MLCPFRNGRNDDNPAQPRYGRIERINGVDYFVPPFGDRPRLNMSAYAQGGATRLAQKQAGITPQPVLLEALHSLRRQALLAQLIHLGQLQGRQFGDLAAHRLRQ